MSAGRSRGALEAVLRLRGLAESRARAVVAAAACEAASAEQRRLDTEGVVKRGSNLKPDQVLRPAVLAALRISGLASDEHLRQAVAQEEQTTRILGERRSEWAAAHRELDSVQRLEERRRVRLARRATIAEERTMDELVTIRGAWR